MLEDNPDDVELVLYELGAAGIECTWKRVCTPDSFLSALEESWDVILADFTMPSFSAPAALELLKETGKDIPFIIVSGSVGEAVAVRAMKAGAHDFFAKSNLSRLGAAIEREIREAGVRRERREAFAQLRRAEARHRLIVQNVRDYAIVMLDREGRIESWNAGAERLTGYTEREMLGRSHAFFFTDEQRAAGVPEEALRRAGTGTYEREHLQVRRDGTTYWALVTIDAIRDEGELVGYAAIVRDTTEHKAIVEGLERAVRAREEFLSVASHELRTPL
ncbi:MAG TPA: PAS domain S-box protein, partial [Sandaracinaceae bacterium]